MLLTEKWIKIVFIHLGIALILPIIISILISINQHLVISGLDNYRFLQILWILTCTIPMWIPAIILKTLPFFYTIITSLIIRLLCLSYNIYLHKKNKKIGYALEIIFVICNILLGVIFLFLMQQ